MKMLIKAPYTVQIIKSDIIAAAAAVNGVQRAGIHSYIYFIIPHFGNNVNKVEINNIFSATFIDTVDSLCIVITDDVSEDSNCTFRLTVHHETCYN